MGFFRYILDYFKRETAAADKAAADQPLTPRQGGTWWPSYSGQTALCVATVYRCAKLLAESVANLPVQYMRQKGGIYVEDTDSRLAYLLNVQPEPAIDYAYINGLGDRGKMTGEWLAHCQACSAPEFACVLGRAGIRYDIVTGYLQEAYVWEQIGAWIDAARAVAGMRENRLGILGHYYGGMLDVYTDTTLQSIAFGTHIEHVEMCELKALRDATSAKKCVYTYTHTCDTDPQEVA